MPGSTTRFGLTQALGRGIGSRKRSSMFYLGLAIFLLLAGYNLITGDGSIPGGKIPFHFGEYKNVLGVFFLASGALLLRLGVRSLREQRPDDKQK